MPYFQRAAMAILRDSSFAVDMKKYKEEAEAK